MIGPNTSKIEFQGESRSLHAWIDKLGLQAPKKLFYERYFRYGWPPEKVFSSKGTSFAKRIDNAVECVHEMMLARGYFRKENRIWRYKMLNTWYKEFRSENMKAA